MRGDAARCLSCPEPLLLPENETAARWASLCWTQWRVAGMGDIIGFDYAAADAAARWAGLQPTAEDFDKLRVIERTMVAGFTKPTAKEPSRGRSD